MHDQGLAITETRVGLDLGLRGGFGASLVFPIRMVTSSIRYLDADDAEVELVRPGIHHRNETLTGIGDATLLASYTRTVGRVRLGARGGMSLPFGRTEEDPFELGDRGLAHQHIQMGRGTIDPVIAIEASRAIGAWRLGGFAFTQQTLYENVRGYQAGDRYAGGVSVRRRVGARWTLRGGGEVQAETAERWGGVVHTDDGNQGRIDAMLAAGASWTTGRATVDLGVKVPVVTHVVGGQLDMPAILELGVSWSFGKVEEHDHDHEHEHEHDEHEHHEHAEADLTGLDVASIGRHDPLVPVPGKITIFDFWATWCEPCEALLVELAALARANPDGIAIRRIDVSDGEVDFKLPHVTIFDAAGAQVLDLSSDGDLDALIDAIRAAVE